MATFAEVLKGLREKAGISQVELAVRAGTSQRAISFWEQGLRDPSLANLKKLCDALGVRCETFFETTDPKGKGESPPANRKPRGKPKGKK